MRSFDAIDAELSAITVSESAITRALEGARVAHGKSLADVDALLGALGASSYVASPRAPEPVPESAPLDVDALFEDVGSSRHSMLAPLSDEPLPVMPDVAPSAAGDLAGLLEGGGSMIPPAPEDDEALASASMALPISVATPIEEEYEEMRADGDVLDDDEPLSTEIEILED